MNFIERTISVVDPKDPKNPVDALAPAPTARFQEIIVLTSALRELFWALFRNRMHPDGGSWPVSHPR
jgi:hypothetical protein